MKPAPAGLVGVGPYVFDCANGLLSRDGAEIPLPPRAVGILTSLVERAGDVVPKQALMDRVWKDTFVTEVSLVEAISLLRQTLQDDPQRPAFIQTVPRRGYRLVAPVRPLARPLRPGADSLRIGRAGEDGPQFQDSPAEVGRVLVAETIAAGRGTVAEEAAAAEEQVWPGWLGWTFAAVATVALAMVSAGLLQQPGVRERPVVRFAIDTSLFPSEHDAGVPRIAISPNGQHVAFVGSTSLSGAAPRLYVRELDRLELKALAGTDGASAPFFSPDGQWIGFFADRALKKVPVSAGAVVTLAGAPRALGGAWLTDDSIVFGGGAAPGLSRVSARGGRVLIVSTPDMARGEVRHAWPDPLTRRRGVIFTALSPDGAPESARVAAIDLGTGRIQPLVAGTFGRLAPPAHLLFARGGALLAAPLDEDTLTVVGPAATVLRESSSSSASWAWRPLVDPPSGVAHLAVSKSGTLVLSGLDHAEWIERTPPTGTVGSLDPATVRASRASVDGRRVALAIGDGNAVDLHLAGPTGSTRLTARGGIARPVWTADGQGIVYASRTGDGAFNLFLRPAEANAAETRLTTSPRAQLPSDVSADGSTLVFTELAPDTGMDVWLLPLDGAAPASVAVRGPGDQTGGTLSPDKRWLAYLSDATGEWQVMLQDRAHADRRDRVVGPGSAAGVAWASTGWTLTVPHRGARLTCGISEDAVGCSPSDAGASRTIGTRDPLRFEIVLDWARELAVQVPSPQQPVRAVR